MMDRHPFALIAHFRPGELHGPILDATGDLLIRELEECGWHTDDFYLGNAPGLRGTGLWVLEGELISLDEDIDVDGDWRRPTAAELERLCRGLPVWGGAR